MMTCLRYSFIAVYTDKPIKALNEYELIKEGDRIAVCISGGKDSMLLAKCMQEINTSFSPFESKVLP